MTAETLQNHETAAAVYHQQLQDLAMELQTAIKAIASNSVADLEESVAKQEMLCCSLSSLARTLSEDLRVSSSQQQIKATLSGEVSQKIRTANQAVLDLNLQYASLLKHSGRSIALLSSLCKSHTGQFPEVRGARLGQHTWSCQM
jgi:hypothetical protein